MVPVTDVPQTKVGVRHGRVRAVSAATQAQSRAMAGANNWQMTRAR